MGLLTSNSTLDIKDSSNDGVVVLQPTAGDTSTATINRTQAGSTRIKARQRLKYATVNASNTLKLSDVSLGKNCFFGILFRTQVPEALASSEVKLFESVQTIASGVAAGQPKLRMFISGRSSSYTYKGRVYVRSETNDGNITDTSDVINGLFKMYGSGVASQDFYGSNVLPKIEREWNYYNIKRSTSIKNSGGYFLSQGAISFVNANTMHVGVGVTDDETILRSLSTQGAITVGSTLGTLAANALENINNIDLVFGGSAADVDIARIVKIDASLNAEQAAAVMRGGFLSNIGTLSVAWDSVTAFTTGTRVSDGGNEFIALQGSTNQVTSNVTYWRPAQDFQINFGSLAEAGAKITVNTGSFVGGDTNSLLREVDAGTVTTTLAKTVSSGKVTL